MSRAGGDTRGVPARRALPVLVAVLAVLGVGCSAPSPAPPPPPAAVEPYRAAVLAQADAFQSATRTLTDAVRAGDVAAAKAAYQPAHRRYVALEPLAEDVDVRIDGRTDTGDARFTGFHRIEKALWADGSLAGMVGYANAMDLDAMALRQVVGRASFRPGDVATMANDWLTACMVTMVTGNEERWARTDLDDLATAVGSAHAAYAALRPGVRDPGLTATLDARFAAVTTLLDTYRRGDGFADYATVTAAQRRRLATELDALAEPVSQLAAAV
jgi:iron uptake system component EfeO